MELESKLESKLNPSTTFESKLEPSTTAADIWLRTMGASPRFAWKKLCLQSLNRPLAQLSVPTPRSTSSRPMLAFDPRRETNRLPAWLASLVVRTYRLPAWLVSLVVWTNTCDIYAKKHMAPCYRSCIQSNASYDPDPSPLSLLMVKRKTFTPSRTTFLFYFRISNTNNKLVWTILLQMYYLPPEHQV